MAEPFAYIAHKDNHWAGICSPEVGRKELKDFLGGYAADGFSITTAADRDEYDRIIKGMKFWHDHPDYKAKKSAKICSETSRGPLGLD